MSDNVRQVVGCLSTMNHSEMREFTRQAIMDAFWALYREKPIERISVKEITELAGYNRSTFYEYFTDTYSVLEAIEDELLDYARDKLRRELPPSLAVNYPSIDLTAEALRPLSDLYIEKGEAFSLLVGEQGDPSFQSRYKRMVKSILFDMLGNPSAKFDVRATIISEYTASAIIGAFSYWYQHRDELPPERFASLLLSLLNRGVLSTIAGL